MFKLHDIARVATAAVRALVLASLSVAAAVGPGHMAVPGDTAYASIPTDRAHG